MPFVEAISLSTGALRRHFGRSPSPRHSSARAIPASKSRPASLTNPSLIACCQAPATQLLIDAHLPSNQSEARSTEEIELRTTSSTCCSETGPDSEKTVIMSVDCRPRAGRRQRRTGATCRGHRVQSGPRCCQGFAAHKGAAAASVRAPFREARGRPIIPILASRRRRGLVPPVAIATACANPQPLWSDGGPQRALGARRHGPDRQVPLRHGAPSVTDEHQHGE